MNSKSTLSEKVQIAPDVMQKIRHSLSSGLSFLDTSAASAAGKNVDYPAVMKLQGYGTEKIRSALNELDKILDAGTNNT